MSAGELGQADSTELAVLRVAGETSPLHSLTRLLVKWRYYASYAAGLRVAQRELGSRASVRAERTRERACVGFCVAAWVRTWGAGCARAGSYWCFHCGGVARVSGRARRGSHYLVGADRPTSPRVLLGATSSAAVALG